MRLALPLLATLAACAAAPPRRSDGPPFDCRGRRASFVVHKVIGFDERSAAISCEGDVPLAVAAAHRDDGTEARAEGGITRDAFEDAWDVIAGSGWRQMRDCADAPADPGEGYVIEIVEGASSVTLRCSKELRFPYDQIVRALDRAAETLPQTSPSTE